MLIQRYDYYATAEGRKKVIEHAANSSQWKDDYSCGFDIEYFLESGYAELTRTEWLEELNGFWTTSWEKWQKYHTICSVTISFLLISIAILSAELEKAEKGVACRTFSLNFILHSGKINRIMVE